MNEKEKKERKGKLLIDQNKILTAKAAMNTPGDHNKKPKQI